ncbi:MAG TPA: radical SAM protein, partial [Pseudothermotoga sp.]
MILRASVGTLYKLRLRRGVTLDLETAYLMLDGKCQFNCLYCTHALTSKTNHRFLSRVIWEKISLDQIIEPIKSSDLKRICIQTVSYKGYRKDLRHLLTKIKQTNRAISISVRAENIDEVNEYFELGVDRVSIALDVASERFFTKIRGGSFQQTMKLLEDSSRSFPKKISTHIIVGLGETDRELFEVMNKMRELEIQVALFAFMPIKGTVLSNTKRPSIERYRRIQLARYLIFTNRADLIVLEGNDIVGFKQIPADAGSALLTSGCPDCSRPYYNEKPGEPLYNIHSKELLKNIDLMREVK